MAFAGRYGKDHWLRTVAGKWCGISVCATAWYRPFTRGWISTTLFACATLFRLATKTGGVILESLPEMPQAALCEAGDELFAGLQRMMPGYCCEKTALGL